jgi:hypothetical protein
MKNWLKKSWSKNNQETNPALNEQPSLLKATTLSAKDIGLFKWDSNYNPDLLTISNNEQTIEWGPRKPQYKAKYYPPAWVPALTLSHLHSSRFQWDFVVEEMANAQIGIGFMLLWDIGPDWGFFGYLGASDTAWSYDPSTGDVVSNTKSIQGQLPTFVDRHRGTVTVHLDLPRHTEGTARFSINGTDTQPILLPQSSVVLPAACFLKESQKVRLANFQQT